jgi:hypothetical protein
VNTIHNTDESRVMVVTTEKRNAEAERAAIA